MKFVLKLFSTFFIATVFIVITVFLFSYSVHAQKKIKPKLIEKYVYKGGCFGISQLVEGIRELSILIYSDNTFTLHPKECAMGRDDTAMIVINKRYSEGTWLQTDTGRDFYFESTLFHNLIQGDRYIMYYDLKLKRKFKRRAK